MKNWTMPSRQLDLDDSWDVIVVGGGPAGCTAAAAAAREGARTLLIEATGCLGGMGTLGLVPAWCPFSDKEKLVYRGLAERVFNAVKAGMPHVKSDAWDWVPIDPELLKRVYDDLVTEAGAQVLFNTVLSGVDAEGGEVRALVVTNKAGLSALKAKVYVDCTGDGDLATWAGAEFEKGGEAGELQPATHCFVLGNVDDYAYLHGPRLHGGNPQSPMYALVKSGKYPLIPDVHMCNNTIGPGTVGFNAGHLWDVDNTDPRSVSRALVQGRKMAAQFRDALAEYHPKAFANSFLVMTGALMGVRETRRIIGDYVLTVQDYLDRRTFDDEICRNCYYIDVHHTPQEIEAINKGTYDHAGKGLHYEKGESHGIPYRCLTPKGLRNVLVAGRAVSCDRQVLGSVRVMPVCLSMGEAAGMAAAHAGTMPSRDVHAVDVKRLRARLREEKVFIL